jgi:hypothetical protein
MFKRFKVIFFSLLMVIANEGVGQASNNDVRRSLEGSWLLLEQHSDSLFLTRNLIVNFNQGHRFDLNWDGTFFDTYSAWCGNDPNFHNYEGSWKLDTARMILTTTFQGSLKINFYKVIELTEYNLVLVKVG